MFEILGIVFGGVSRLAQSFLESRDAQKERDHEYRMYQHQVELANKKMDVDYDLRQMDVGLARDEKEMDLLATAIKAQAEEARAAGGWVAQLSASVRPMISYWLLLLYSIAKLVGFLCLLSSGETLKMALIQLYTPFDGALLGSVVSYWFADRSLRKAGK